MTKVTISLIANLIQGVNWYHCELDTQLLELKGNLK